MTSSIKLQKSAFYNEAQTRDRLCEFIKETEFFSMGQKCSELEVEFAKKQERSHAIFVSSGSAANLILIQAFLNLGRLQKGDKVGVSALTWATNVMPLIQLGLKPVPLDCDLTNLNVTTEILAKNSNLEIKALFLTNVLGFSGDIVELKKYCKKAGILLLEDNCESLGSRVANTLLGNFGVASTFSTFVGHHMSTIEGGFVCTDDTELYNMLLMIRAHGWDRNLPKTRVKELREEHEITEFQGKYTFYDLAYNVRPTELQGFIGLEQMQYMDVILKNREINFYKFLEATRKNSEIIQLDVSHMNFVSNFAMPVVFNDNFSFRKYKDRFLSKGVEIRPVISGNITKQPFFKKYVKSEYKLVNTDIVHNNGFYFANNPELTSDEVELLCDLLSN